MESITVVSEGMAIVKESMQAGAGSWLTTVSSTLRKQTS